MIHQLHQFGGAFLFKNSEVIAQLFRKFGKKMRRTKKII